MKINNVFFISFSKIVTKIYKVLTLLTANFIGVKLNLMKTTKKLLLLIFSLLIFGTGFSQVEQQSKESLNQNNLPYFKLREPAGYTLDKQEFTFSPELNRIHIKKLEDEKEVDFGDLRRTTDDGLFIMTSASNKDVSFGRFDSIGNFRTLRYDRKNDTVIEEWYMLAPEDPE